MLARVRMEIRNLTIDDYETMIKLWSKAKLPFKPKGRDSKEAIAAQMKANPDFFLGAFDGNRLIGTVVVSCDMRKGWINRLAVDPEYRLHGVAKALIAESEKILRKHGIRIVCALIEDDNVASKRLFKKLGYVEHRDIIYFSKRESEEV
ncbi:MAG: GNAT family N-acetyltransferase [Candidatus Bathyarchaeia archaeon]